MSLQHHEETEQERFDPETVRRITTLASQMQHDAETGLTAEQVEHIADEVGIGPAYVRRAVDQVRESETVGKVAGQRRLVAVTLGGVLAGGLLLPLALLIGMSRPATTARFAAPPTPVVVDPPARAAVRPDPFHAPLVEAVSLVRGGDFEKPIAGGGWVSYSAGDRIGQWKVESGTVDLKGTRYKAHSGRQLLDLNGASRGAVSQELQTERGRRYTLRFALTQNPDGGPGTRGVRVLWNDTSLGTVTVDRRNGHSHWSHLEYEVSGTGRDRLRFESQTDGSQGAFLDSVTVKPVQETP